MMEMKDIIKARRIELKLTQKEVADYVGVSEATLSRWESGEIQNLRRNRIAALAKILRISPSSIVGDADIDSYRNSQPDLSSLPLSVDETQLIEDYRFLNDAGKAAASSYISYLKTEDKYKKISPATAESCVGA